jgi:hypothetical protein
VHALFDRLDALSAERALISPFGRRVERASRLSPLTNKRFAPLPRLHDWQTSWMFRSVYAPPRLNGTYGQTQAAPATRSRSHRPWSRCHTAFLTSRLIAVRAGFPAVAKNVAPACTIARSRSTLVRIAEPFAAREAHAPRADVGARTPHQGSSRAVEPETPRPRARVARGRSSHGCRRSPTPVGPRRSRRDKDDTADRSVEVVGERREGHRRVRCIAYGPTVRVTDAICVNTDHGSPTCSLMVTDDRVTPARGASSTTWTAHRATSSSTSSRRSSRRVWGSSDAALIH